VRAETGLARILLREISCEKLLTQSVKTPAAFVRIALQAGRQESMLACLASCGGNWTASPVFLSTHSCSIRYSSRRRPSRALAQGCLLYGFNSSQLASRLDSGPQWRARGPVLSRVSM